MELHRFLGILRRGWLLIVLFAVIGLIGAAVAVASTPTRYAAVTRLFVTIETTANATAGDLVAGNSFAIQKVTSYVAVASSPIVLSPVITDLGLDTTPAALARDVTVAVAPNSAIIEISALGDTADQSADLTEAIASSFTDVVVNEIEAPADGSPSPVGVQVIQPAVTPDTPALPQIPLYLGVGLVLGLALGLAVALLLGYLDRRLRTRADVERATVHPVLGSIPDATDFKRRALIMRDGSTTPSAEAFRSLRTNVQFVGFEGRARSIVVAAATAGEGTSTVVANLAVSLAEVGSSVAIVDADLRSPSIGAIFGLEPAAGLSEVITGRTPLKDAIVSWRSGLSILPAGSAAPNPSELLGSVTMSEILAALTAAFDYVIIDSPAVLSVTDAAVLSRMTSGTVLVVGTRQVRGDQVSAAVQTLERAGGSTVGVVANRVAPRGADSDVTTRAAGAGLRGFRRGAASTRSVTDESVEQSGTSVSLRRDGTARQRART